MIGTAYSDVLDKVHREALHISVGTLMDELAEDIANLLTSEEFAFADTSMADYLPRRYLPRYGGLFAKKFLTCLIVAAWKLNQAERLPLSCLAEELAAAAVIDHAKGVLGLDETSAEFGHFEEELFEDLDFEWLFDESADGIDESDTGRELGMTPLSFDQWFEPFNPPRPNVHPYVENE